MMSVVLISAVSFLFGQNGTIEGVIKDKNEQPLAFATITVFLASDTSIVNYKLSDPKGNFRISQIPLDKELRLLVSFTGYESHRVSFTLTKESSKKSFGDIILEDANETLDAVVITAEQPPVVMRKDTIEFNAASFKTLPTAMVDELLNKLPGVTMTEDGNFMINGRRVNRILVDGREFFGNDAKATTKNLPAFTVAKVQVHNDERDLFADPNRPLNDVGQVINLQLKKEYKKGLFGKVYAGGGTDDRYEAGGIVNMFRDTTQVSLLGYTNNLSKSGVSMQDLMAAGGMDRSGISSVALTDGGGMSINGLNFGGMAGAGIETVTGGGININHNVRKKLDLNAQYYINHSEHVVNSNSLREQYIQNDVLSTDRVSNSITNSTTHNVSLRAFWKVDTSMTIEFNPRLNAKNGYSNNPEFSTTIKNNLDQLNSSDINARSNNGNTNYDHNLYLNKRYKPGTSLNFSNRVQISNGNNVFYNKLVNAYLGADSLYLNRRQERDIINKGTYNSLSYNKKINNTFDVRMNYTLNYDEKRSGVYTYDSPFKEELYNIYVGDLSDDFKRIDWNNSLTARLGIHSKKIKIFPTVKYSNLSFNNVFMKLNTEQKNQYNFVLPAIEIRILDKYYLGFSKEVILPGIDQMQPVVNANNPMNIIIGNPDLVPVRSNSIFVSSHGFGNPKFNYNIYVNGNFMENGISSDRTIDALGNQTTKWVHVSGNKSFFSDMNFNRIFTVSTKNKFSIGFNGGFSLNDRNSILNGEKIASISTDYRFGGRTSFNLGNLLDFNLRYMHTIRVNKFKSSSIEDFTYNTKNLSSEIIYRPSKNFVISPKYTMIYRQLTGPGMPKYINQLNASLTYQFLENQRAQITLTGFDLLKQNQSINRTIGENFILDSRTTVLTQYFLLTFSYNINNFASKVQKNMFRFW